MVSSSYFLRWFEDVQMEQYWIMLMQNWYDTIILLCCALYNNYKNQYDDNHMDITDAPPPPIPHPLHTYLMSPNHWRCLFSSLLNSITPKKTQKLRITGLCDGNPPVYAGLSPKRASNVMTSSFVANLGFRGKSICLKAYVESNGLLTSVGPLQSETRFARNKASIQILRYLVVRFCDMPKPR